MYHYYNIYIASNLSQVEKNGIPLLISTIPTVTSPLPDVRPLSLKNFPYPWSSTAIPEKFPLSLEFDRCP